MSGASDWLAGAMREHAQRLSRALARRYSGLDADDLVQDACVRALEHGEVAVLRPDGWLYRIASRLALDGLRRHACEARLLTDHSTPASAADLHHTAIRRQEVEQVRAALATLPPDCAEAFWLARVEGFTHAEIARQLGLSTKTVQRHVQRAFAACRAAVDG